MKTVFLTGASGNMGAETMNSLLEQADLARIKVLLLPSDRKLPVVRAFEKHEKVAIIWGDLTNYDDVLAGVEGSDYVLHVGGMVSPAADRLPELTRKVNIGAAENIVRAIKAQPSPDSIRLVYIGTVAQTGSRMPPFHWGRTGDPIKISEYDNYAVTKTQAEAIIAESGLLHWVSLRQTAMAHVNIWKIVDPIRFHNPLNGVFEWATAKDSGRLVANTCKPEVPSEFWRGFYNIGGGQSCRTVNHQFMARMTELMGIKDYRKVSRPNWQATQNFHGQWYSDSDKLNELVPFRSQSIDDFFADLKKVVPWIVKAIGKLSPNLIFKKSEDMASAPGGPLFWAKTGDDAHMNAYFGSTEAWEKLPSDWNDFQLASPSTVPTQLDHGYDETLPVSQWTIGLLQAAAKFRGGKCLSADMSDAFSPVHWQCALGHDFLMTPNLFLRGGHWCPTCMIDTSCYSAVAEKSPFFAQIAQC